MRNNIEISNYCSSFVIAIRAEKRSTQRGTYRFASTSRVRRWAPNIVGEKLQKKKKKKKKNIRQGIELGNPAWNPKHFTTRSQRPMLYLCSIRILYT